MEESNQMEDKTEKASHEIHHGNQFVKILKYSPWYLVATVLTKMSAVILMPIFTKYLSPEDYGILNTLRAFGGALPVFISLAIDQSFLRYYFLEKKISHENVRILYSTLFWFIVAWGVVVTVIALLTSPIMFKSLVKIPFWPFLPLVILPMLLTQLSALGSAYLRSNLQTRTFTGIKLIQFVSSTTLAVTLLVHFKLGIKAPLYGNFVGVLLSLGWYTYLSVKYSLLAFCFDWGMLKRSMKYSIPFVPILASSWIAGLSDRLILAYYGRIKEVGLYSISANISRMLYFANDAITQVQGPIGMSALTENRDQGKKQIGEFLMVFVWGMSFAYLVLTLFSKEILFFVANERYHSAYKLVGILAFPFLIGGIYRPFSVIISFHAKTWLFTAASFIQAAINAALNFAFIPYYGQFAAAWSTCFSASVYTIWVIWWAQKLDPIPVKKKDVISILLIVGAILALYVIVDSNEYISLWTKFLVKVVLVGIYILVSVTNTEFRNFLGSVFMLIRKRLISSRIGTKKVIKEL